jgi:tripartite-type tricarboxylate transporter receptor subunit TctC
MNRFRPDRRNALRASAALAAMLAGANGLQAQTAWPSRPIKLIVPYPAGGNADSIGRLLAELDMDIDIHWCP